jgi:hypothetical protein
MKTGDRLHQLAEYQIPDREATLTSARAYESPDRGSARQNS